jgi:hypothetical protein
MWDVEDVGNVRVLLEVATREDEDEEEADAEEGVIGGVSQLRERYCHTSHTPSATMYHLTICLDSHSSTAARAGI